MTFFFFVSKEQREQNSAEEKKIVTLMLLKLLFAILRIPDQPKLNAGKHAIITWRSDNVPLTKHQVTI